MRIKTIMTSVASALAVVLGHPALAAPKVIGNWLLTVEADRFSDAATNVIALTEGTGGDGVLAVRCLRGNLSIALGGTKFDTGDKFLVKFRADKNIVIDTTGTALSETIMQLDTTHEMVRQMLTAKEYAFRVIGTSSKDFVFRAGRGAAKVLGEVTKPCPLSAGND
ncbi:MAG: hypothetical protein KIT48_12090 [Pseudolabrys sp.]|nr:hypothetical protein [Pseudolabrys sp.]